MKILFIGNPIEAEKADKHYKFFAIPDNYMQIKFMNEIHLEFNDDFELITVNYEDFKKREVKKFNNIKTTFIKTNIKNVFFYYLSFMCAICKEIFKYLRKNKKEKVIIITNGPYIYYSLPVILAKLFYRFKYICYLVCAVKLPQYKGLYGLVASLSKHAIKSADATITYVEKSSVDYTKKPYFVLNYQVDDLKVKISKENLKKYNNKTNRKIKLVYTGALTRVSGIHILLNVIKKLPDNYQLILCGEGECKKEVIEFSKINPNKIKYLGVISMEDSIKLQCSADILILLRANDTKEEAYFNDYAGSCKLNEYLLSEVPIIVNNHGALSKDLKPYLNIMSEVKIEYLVNEIIKITNNLNSEEIRRKCKLGRQFVIKNCLEGTQSKRLCEFIKSVNN